eukprot:jgi/Mesvir1/20449/Mv25333-RA.1
MGLNCSYENFYTDAGVNCNLWRDYGTGGSCTKFWGLPPAPFVPEYCIDSGFPSRDFYPVQVQTHINSNVSAALNRDGLHIISIGGNDVMMAFFGTGGDPIVMMNRTAQAREAIMRGVEMLYESGARHFFLANLPPLLLLPGSRMVSPLLRELGDEFVQQYAEDYHSSLVLPLRSRLTNATITEINLLGCMYEMNANCTFRDLGFTNWIDPCILDRFNASTPICSDPSKYVWWDTAHGTTAFHRVLAAKYKDVIDGKPNACLLTRCLGDSETDSCPGGNNVCSIAPHDLTDSAAARGGLSVWATIGAALLGTMFLVLSF